VSNDPRWPAPGRTYLSAIDSQGDAVTTPVPDRPNPIMNAVASVGSAVSAVLGVVTFLIQYGVLTPEQGEAITSAGEVVVTNANPLASIVSALFVAFTGVAASFTAGKVAKAKVTPVEDPRNNLGEPLTPAGL
jgi:hypothetical protein